MPLFGAGPNYRAQLSAASKREKQPPLVAIGSSCRVARAADDTDVLASAEPFAHTYGHSTSRDKILAHKPLGTRSMDVSRAFPRVRKHHTMLASSHKKSTTLIPIFWEEQVARLKLQCSEQEARVSLALFILSQHQQRTQGLQKTAQDAMRQQQPSHSFPTVRKSKEMHSTPACSETPLMTGRRGRWTSLQTSIAERRNGERDDSRRSPASPPAPLVVKDSELLRALQRAEARIRELEMAAQPRSAAQTNVTASNQNAQVRQSNENDTWPTLAALSEPSIVVSSGVAANVDVENYPYLCGNLIVL